MQQDIVPKPTTIIHYVMRGACYKESQIPRAQKHVPLHVMQRKDTVSTPQLFRHVIHTPVRPHYTLSSRSFRTFI